MADQKSTNQAHNKVFPPTKYKVEITEGHYTVHDHDGCVQLWGNCSDLTAAIRKAAIVNRRFFTESLIIELIRLGGNANIKITDNTDGSERELWEFALQHDMHFLLCEIFVTLYTESEIMGRVLTNNAWLLASLLKGGFSFSKIEAGGEFDIPRIANALTRQCQVAMIKHGSDASQILDQLKAMGMGPEEIGLKRGHDHKIFGTNKGSGTQKSQPTEPPPTPTSTLT